MKHNQAIEPTTPTQKINSKNLVHISGHIDFGNTLKSLTKEHIFQNEGHFVLNLSNGLLSNQSGFYELFGYAKSFTSTKELLNICYKRQLPLMIHLLNTYMSFISHHILAQENTALHLTCKIKKRNNTYIKVLCQISVCESHENQLTKLLIKFTDIDFISTSCDMAWTLKSNKEQIILFKTMVAQKFNHLFSARELEIVNQMQFSLNNAEIGDKLFISTHTVATHRKNIYKKSKLHSTHKLISFCRERGLI